MPETNGIDTWPLRTTKPVDYTQDFRSKVKWLLIVRLSMFVLITVAVVFRFSTEGFLFKALFLYGVITLGYLLSLFWRKRTSHGISFKFLCAIQLLFELVVEIIIIHYSGGIASPFTVLIGLSIITSAFIFDLAGTLITATFGSIMFALMVFFEYRGIFDLPLGFPGVELIYKDPDLLFFTTYIFVCFLYLIAFLIGYLSGRLHVKLGQLQESDRALRRARMDTDDILMHMRSGLITMDPDGHVVYFNQAAGELLEIDPKTATGRFLTDILPAKARPFSVKLSELLAPGGGRVRTGEFTLRIADDENVTMLLACSFLTSPDGSLRGIIALLEDITDQKRRDEYLKEVEKMATIGELSASLAHEIRNPLAAIRASVEILGEYDDTPDNNRDRRLKKLIMKETDRLTNVLDEFLIFARLKELPKEQFTYNRLDIAQLIGEIVEILRTTPDFSPNIEIVLELKGPLWILGRGDQLKNVFYNLLINAREAIGDVKGKITISSAIERDGFYAQRRLIGVSITDNGRGISEKDMPNIFTPFYSIKPRGTGLGLAIAQGIVNRHSGIIEAENRPDSGARFTVYLLKAPEDV